MHNSSVFQLVLKLNETASFVLHVAHKNYNSCDMLRMSNRHKNVTVYDKFFKSNELHDIILMT